jgi:2-(1,2-epoxy-1,2-dihydrophenyl)acetyl-CoA isomerase
MSNPDVLNVQMTDGLAVVTLNRPEAMNALNLELKQALAEWLAAARYDTSLRAVLLTGAGRAFCAGGDLKEMDPGRSAQEARMRQDQLLRTVYRPLAALPVPVVAAVNGHAHGGGLSLALACDIVIASAEAPMSLGFVHRGLAPDCAISHLLPRLVGAARAKELLLTGRPFDAAEAREIGMIAEVVPGEQLMERATNLALTLARGATVALGLAKTMVDQSWDLDFDQFVDVESNAQAISRTSADHREGVDAFFQKRTPRFTGT